MFFYHDAIQALVINTRTEVLTFFDHKEEAGAHEEGGSSDDTGCEGVICIYFFMASLSGWDRLYSRLDGRVPHCGTLGGGRAGIWQPPSLPSSPRAE